MVVGSLFGNIQIGVSRNHVNSFEHRANNQISRELIGAHRFQRVKHQGMVSHQTLAFTFFRFAQGCRTGIEGHQDAFHRGLRVTYLKTALIPRHGVAKGCIEINPGQNIAH